MAVNVEFCMAVNVEYMDRVCESRRRFKGNKNYKERATKIRKRQLKYCVTHNDDRKLGEFNTHKS